MSSMQLTERRCCVCKFVKPIASFGPHKGNSSGRQYECRQCVNEKVKRYAAKNGEQYKQQKREYDRQRVARLKDKLAEQAKIRYEANRAKRIAYVKDWQEKNPEKAKAIKQNYKHKRRAQEATGASYSEVLEWRRSQPKVCHWCGFDCSVDAVVDHYFPLSKGGRHEVSNLVISCRSCNARKSNKLPDQWIAELKHRDARNARVTAQPSSPG